jgi:uncharacterized damage-inducible protein DinB
MKQVQWFNRKFNFSFEQNIFPSIIERLEGRPLRLKDKIRKIPQAQLTIRYEDSWSIQENVGHLIDLEPLWQGRLEDILNGEKYLRPTDLQNRKTDLAGHNEKHISDLLAAFEHLRYKTLEKLKMLNENDVYKSALHPRLEQPMRTMDLFLFVAEHDDHRLARISALNRLVSEP